MPSAELSEIIYSLDDVFGSSNYVKPRQLERYANASDAELTKELEDINSHFYMLLELAPTTNETSSPDDDFEWMNLRIAIRGLKADCNDLEAAFMNAAYPSGGAQSGGMLGTIATLPRLMLAKSQLRALEKRYQEITKDFQPDAPEDRRMLKVARKDYSVMCDQMNGISDVLRYRGYIFTNGEWVADPKPRDTSRMSDAPFARAYTFANGGWVEDT